MCQSVASPSRAEYWHIGAMRIRFSRVRESRVRGSNRRAVMGSSGMGSIWGGAAVRPSGPIVPNREPADWKACFVCVAALRRPKRAA